MKKSLFLFCLLAYILQGYPQGLDHTHNFAIWADAGYSRISGNIQDTSPLGGTGAGIGIGYEYHYKNFILQTGLDLHRLSSLMKYNDFQYSVPMRDTQGRDFDGIFEFYDSKEKQLFNTISLPLLAGFSFRDFYFLAGGKIGLSFHKKTTTDSHITTMANYGMIIGSDGQGLLYDMPNHGLTNFSQTVKGSLKLTPVYTASVEIGKIFKPSVRKNSRNAQSEYFRQQKENENWLRRRVFSRHYYRLAVFCDYGFTSLREKHTEYNTIINTAIQPGAYSPALAPLLYKADNIHTLYTGIKFTLVFEFVSKYPCQCYQACF